MTSQETTTTAESQFTSVYSLHLTISQFPSTWHTASAAAAVTVATAGTTTTTTTTTTLTTTTVHTTKSVGTGSASKHAVQETLSSYISPTSLARVNGQTRAHSSVASKSVFSRKIITSQDRGQSDGYSMQSFPISEKAGHSDLGILHTEKSASISREIVSHTPPARFASDSPSLTSFLALKSDISIARGGSSVASSRLAANLISSSPTANNQKTSQTSNGAVHLTIEPSSHGPSAIHTSKIDVSSTLNPTSVTRDIVSNWKALPYFLVTVQMKKSRSGEQYS